MKHRFAVVHTGRPYGPAEPIPDSAWQVVSRHETLSAAQKRMDREQTEMRQSCGHGAWNDHLAIRALADTILSSTFTCGGPIPYQDSPNCVRATTVKTVWPAGTNKPSAFPDWVGGCCPACHALEAINDQEALSCNG